MSYSKLPKGVTDYSAGFQSVNQLSDNFLAVGNGYALEHHVLEYNARGSNPALPYGKHNTPKVCRAVVRTQATTNFSLAYPGATQVASVVTGIVHFATGVFFIGITALDEFYAVCDPEQSSVTPQRFVLPQSGFGGNGGNVGIVIQLFEKSGTEFVLTDYDFSAHIYGTIS